jgi:hypothetical protein
VPAAVLGAAAALSAAIWHYGAKSEMKHGFQ